MNRYQIHCLPGLLLLGALCFGAPASAATPAAAARPGAVEATQPRPEAQFTPSFRYGDRVLTEDTVWKGAVLVEGAVTVAPQATLTIEPGTVIRFRGKDPSGAVLVVQGRVVAEGTKESPIVFTSSFAVPAAGDWQGVMLLGSEKKNVLENCRIDSAQTGVEAIFSNLTLKNVRAERSRTGMRFQDALLVMEGGGTSDCDTGLGFFESEANLRSLHLIGNRKGIVAQRSSIYLQEGNLSMNGSAFSCDDCRVKVQGGAVSDNGRGITLYESQGAVTGVQVARNSDYGISLTASRMRVTANQVTGNGNSGLLVFDGASVAWDNAIYDNGYDLQNAGKEEFRAPGNWWGAAGPKIHDNDGMGKVLTAPRLAAPPAIGSKEKP